MFVNPPDRRPSDATRMNKSKAREEAPESENEPKEGWVLSDGAMCAILIYTGGQ